MNNIEGMMILNQSASGTAHPSFDNTSLNFLFSANGKNVNANMSFISYEMEDLQGFTSGLLYANSRPPFSFNLL